MFALVSQHIPPRPFLKWAGGKAQLIQQYQSHFPQRYKTYYEPFLGGGAIFFHLSPTQAMLTDINPELVNVYRCVKESVEAVIARLEVHHRSHNPDYYYEMRSTPGKTQVEKAARFIYLNKTCFNGLYRENSKGEFNVPIGRYKSPRICNPDLLYAVSQTLKHTEIQVASFDAVLNYATDPQDFVYFDPPYHPISLTSSFTGYSRYSFHAQDQIRLRDTFAELAQRGVQVMLSNSDCEFVRDLYQDFNIYTISASRAINSNAQKRGKISEVLVTSY
ncbi:MAG: DNA adenine methylase [Oscillatoriophycideae cyanobacterium NC_groundwater_1537_Pr4_S-0.65um_50_18]|nr:DNA adenine methylase [Oscillatoriophycideae cyanobacterium NC_groundwater_1537_Pr4_S-0.65um_50_18]